MTYLSYEEKETELFDKVYPNGDYRLRDDNKSKCLAETVDDLLRTLETKATQLCKCLGLDEYVEFCFFIQRMVIKDAALFKKEISNKYPPRLYMEVYGYRTDNHQKPLVTLGKKKPVLLMSAESICRRFLEGIPCGTPIKKELMLLEFNLPEEQAKSLAAIIVFLTQGQVATKEQEAPQLLEKLSKLKSFAEKLDKDKSDTTWEFFSANYQVILINDGKRFPVLISDANPQAITIPIAQTIEML